MPLKPKPGSNGPSAPTKRPFPIVVPSGEKHPTGNRVGRWMREILPAPPPPPKQEGEKAVDERPKDTEAPYGPIQRATIQLLPGRLEPEDPLIIQQELRFVRLPSREHVVTLGWNIGEPPGHITLNHSSVQPMHARMTYRDGGWWIECLSRTDPVLVNGSELRLGSHPMLLADGDQVRLGAVAFRFHFP